MKYNIFANIHTGLYEATLLDGEFDNCHGQGKTPQQAYISLKLTVRAKRKQSAN